MNASHNVADDAPCVCVLFPSSSLFIIILSKECVRNDFN